MDWRTTYPTIEAISLASCETLSTWIDNLPPPQTDVERTIRRRLGPARHAAAVKEMRRTAPEFAQQYEDIIERFRRLGQRT